MMMTMMRENGRERASEGYDLRVWSFFLFFFCETSYASFSWHGVTAHGFVAFSHSLIHPIHYTTIHPIPFISDFCLFFCLPAPLSPFFSFEILSFFSRIVASFLY